MAAVTICSDFDPKKIKSVTVCIVSPSIFHEMMGPDVMILFFWMLSFKPAFWIYSLTFIKWFFSYSLLSAIRVVSSAYLWLLIFLLVVLIPAYALSSPVFHMMYSTYKINKQVDNIQPWCIPFSIWNQFIVPCPILTVASLPSNRFIRRQVWYSHLFQNFPQFIVIHTVKGFGTVNEAEAVPCPPILNSFTFSVIQQVLPTCSLCPLPFLNPAWTYGNLWFTYCWSLAWRILSITLLTCEMSAIVW